MKKWNKGDLVAPQQPWMTNGEQTHNISSTVKHSFHAFAAWSYWSYVSIYKRSMQREAIEATYLIHICSVWLLKLRTGIIYAAWSYWSNVLDSYMQCAATDPYAIDSYMQREATEAMYLIRICSVKVLKQRTWLIYAVCSHWPLRHWFIYAGWSYWSNVLNLYK
jgi:hypothetical protein